MTTEHACLHVETIVATTNKNKEERWDKQQHMMEKPVETKKDILLI